MALNLRGIYCIKLSSFMRRLYQRVKSPQFGSSLRIEGNIRRTGTQFLSITLQIQVGTFRPIDLTCLHSAADMMAFRRSSDPLSGISSLTFLLLHSASLTHLQSWTEVSNALRQKNVIICYTIIGSK